MAGLERAFAVVIGKTAQLRNTLRIDKGSKLRL